MSPRALMIVGALSGLFALTLSVLGAVPTGGTVIAIFASGAIFGKGYGVWEERCSKERKG